MVDQNIAWCHEATDPFQKIKIKKMRKCGFAVCHAVCFNCEKHTLLYGVFFFSSLTAAFNFLHSTHTSHRIPMYLVLIYGQFKSNGIIINHQKGQQLWQKFLVLGVLSISSLLWETFIIIRTQYLSLFFGLFNLS